MIGADDAPANDNISPNHTPALAVRDEQMVLSLQLCHTKLSPFAASCGVGVAGAAGRAGVVLDLSAALSGARRGIASVLCVMARLANRRGGALRRRRSWSSMEEQGQAGLDRAPGAAEHRPGMDRGCGAQPQVGNAVDGKRTGEDHYETVSLAGIRSSTITTGRSLPSTPRRRWPSAHPRRAPHHPRG